MQYSSALYNLWSEIAYKAKCDYSKNNIKYCPFSRLSCLKIHRAKVPVRLLIVPVFLFLPPVSWLLVVIVVMMILILPLIMLVIVLLLRVVGVVAGFRLLMFFFGGVFQLLISLVNLFKMFFWASFIGVQLFCFFKIGLLDLLGRGVLANP